MTDQQPPPLGYFALEVPHLGMSPPLTVDLDGARITTVAALNGDTLVQIALPLTIGGIGLARSWMRERTERLKNVTLIWNGREFRGLSSRELTALLDRMESVSESPPKPAILESKSKRRGQRP